MTSVVNGSSLQVMWQGSGNEKFYFENENVGTLDVYKIT